MADLPLLYTLFLYSSICFSRSDPLAALGMLAVLKSAFCFCVSLFSFSSLCIPILWNLIALCLFCRCSLVSSCYWMSFLLQAKLILQYSHHFFPAIQNYYKINPDQLTLNTHIIDLQAAFLPFYQRNCSSTKYNYKMSTERQERSASFTIKQRAVKVNHNSKLLPLDFFPKINSQSPKKKHEFAPQKADSLLVEWYDREDSKEKSKRVYRRLANPRPTTSRVSLCAAEQSSQIQKQRYVLDYYNRVKENLKAKDSPVKLPSTIPRPIFGEERRFIRRKASISFKEKQQSVVRLARSQSKPRRGKTPESSAKEHPLPTQHRSQRELPHRFDEQEVAYNFDGMVTFSKFK